jgi:dTDP-4-amino-4,6-dideoxygalactose transaminase
MLPRNQIDIGWLDLLFGLAACSWPGRRVTAQQQVEAAWPPGGGNLASLSVRTGFDLLLEALDWPRGSEVLVSAVTIRDMARIVEEHGFVPVPVDLDMASLSLKASHLEGAITPNTKAILVAHLFGSRVPLDDVSALARQHGLLLIEDCAQSFAGLDYHGHPGSDVCMFSFGPIKTNTALGGAILRVKNRALLARLRDRQAHYSAQSRWFFFKRLCQYAALKLVINPLVFGVFVGLCRLAGRSHDAVISAAVRGFPGPDFFTKIRQQPSYPLLALLQRRLSRFDPARIERRKAVADRAIALMPAVPRPGATAAHHSHWIFPILAIAPERLIQHLWREGFDATRGASSLYTVEAPDSHADLSPREARQAMQKVVYLPIFAGTTDRDLRRLARVLAECGALATDAATADGMALSAHLAPEAGERA